MAEKNVLGDIAGPSESAGRAKSALGVKAPPLNVTKRLPLVQLDPNAPPIDAAVAGASSIVFCGGINVLSSQIQTKETSHQIQVEQMNKQKQADVNNLAHVRAMYHYRSSGEIVVKGGGPHDATGDRPGHCGVSAPQHARQPI